MHEYVHGVADVDPIPGCEGLSQWDWKDKNVVLVNVNGIGIVEVVCCNVDPTYCIDHNQLGFDDDGLVIMISL